MDEIVNQIRDSKDFPIQDKPSNIKVVIPDTKTPVKMPSVGNPTLNYSSYYGRTGKDLFQPSEYNLSEIGKISDVESYVARAFNKKTALMFKEGWDLVGKNPQVIKYVKSRFEQIASVTENPTIMLLRAIGDGLIRKSNAFVVKVRKLESSGGKERQLPNSDQTLTPVAGYFVAPAETMEYEMINNKITKWQQKMPDGQWKHYNSKDVIHFFYDRKEGFVFGTPTLIPVIDDIRALRKIEENIELLIYQHLFPLFHWIVGTPERPAGFNETGQREVDAVKSEIQNMPAEGGIVTSERHEIKAIGAEGRALRAEGYLTYFKRRVFAGLGTSAVDFGENESSNRSTAETMSQNLIDSVKDFQQVMESFVNEYIIKELLLEANFDFDPLDDENKVSLHFREIDIATQIKKEAHYADQFNKYVISWDEARISTGREPIPVPTPEEIDNGQEGPDKYPEWNKSKWMLFDRPKFIIQAVDEPWSSQAKSRQAAEAARAEEVSIKKAAIAAKPSVKNFSEDSGFKVKDSALVNGYDEVKEQLLDYIGKKVDLDKSSDWIRQITQTMLTPISDKLATSQMAMFRKGYGEFSSTTSDNFIKESRFARNRLRERSEHYLDKLFTDISNTINRNTGNSDKQDILNVVSLVFDSFKFRMKAVEDVENKKAFIIGSCIGLKSKGFSKGEVVVDEKACDQCKHKNGETISLNHSMLDSIPPFHPYCECKVKGYQVAEGTKTKDSLENKENYDTKDKVDPTKLESCVLQLKKQLRSKYPDWSEDKVKESAFKICNSSLGKKK